MKRGGGWFRFAFLAPAMGLYGLLFLYPVAQAFFMSLFNWSGLSDNREYVGLKNFQDLAKDKIFVGAIQHNLIIFVGCGIAVLLIAIVVAHLLQGNGRLTKALRASYLLPHMVSMVIVAVMWRFIFNPTLGPVTIIAKALGVKDPPAWLGDTKTALLCVMVAFIWYGFCFYSMLFAAGIKGIPEEIYEAADLDGVRPWQRFRQITWPLLWSIKRMTLTHVAIATMNMFALVQLMTAGGPNRSSEVMLTYLYETGFSNSDFGYATALATVNLVVVLAVAGVINFIYRRNPSGGRDS
ncbi:MAG: sugar ABC transporter permease [Chthonomonas sp.]|nr:sugar ABC transporter permease [Chthonomonas sp.]